MDSWLLPTQMKMVIITKSIRLSSVKLLNHFHLTSSFHKFLVEIIMQPLSLEMGLCFLLAKTLKGNLELEIQVLLTLLHHF